MHLVDCANDSHQFALNLTVVRRGIDRLHRRVRRLETNPVPFMVETLQRGFLLLAEPNRNGLTVLTSLLMAQKHDVAVINQGVDHRKTLNAKGKEVAATVRNE